MPLVLRRAKVSRKGGLWQHDERFERTAVESDITAASPASDSASTIRH